MSRPPMILAAAFATGCLLLGACSSNTDAASSTSAASSTTSPTAATPTTLRAAADAAGIRVGAILEPDEIGTEHSDVLAREFNSLTPENALKPKATEPEQGEFDFSGSDAVVDFALEHDMEIRGHTLVWAQDAWIPDWMKAIDDPADLRAALDQHVRTVMEHYQGKIHRYDVVNEPLQSTGTELADTVFQRVLGSDWVGEVYRTAHEVDPDAELWLNEYGTDYSDGKAEALLAFVEGMLDDGVPIDGVGFQTHRLSVDGPDADAFRSMLQDMADLGVDVAITEVDVITDPNSPDFEAQANAYRTVVEACLAVTRCQEVTTWGISDANSWVDEMGLFPVPGRPLLWDDDYQPKPAYDAVLAALAEGRP